MCDARPKAETFDAGNPRAFKPEEIRVLRDQITSNLERAWEITGRSEDELTGVMVQISQVVAKQFKTGKQ